MSCITEVGARYLRILSRKGNYEKVYLDSLTPQTSEIYIVDRRKKNGAARIHIFRDKTFSANGPIVQLPSLELSEGLLIDLFTSLVILARLAVPGMSESTS